MMLLCQWLTIMRLNVNNLSNSNFNNRLDNIPLSNNNEIEYFLPGPNKESEKKQALKKNTTATKGI